ncbi:MAG: hypothetical protein O7F71_17665 [Gammaproteobacteria bacterium]|nr:hypothetical protein [Gammaproteobacteria bacterium]
MEWTDDLWAVIGGGIGVFASVNVLFFKSDDFFSKQFKEDVSLRLLCLESPNSTNSWSQIFIRLFDRIFKKPSNPNGRQVSEWRQFVSWWTFSRSAVASLFAVLTVFLVGVTVGPISWEAAVGEPFLVILLGLCFNVIPDYLSILETRFILRFFRESRSALTIAGLLAVDAVVTVAIFSVVGVLLFWLAAITYGMDFPSLPRLFLDLVQEYKTTMWIPDPHGSGNVSDLNLLGVFFYSTFFTSVWLWLFGLSHLLVTLASRTGPLLRAVKYILPIDEKPFRSLGIIAGLIAMLSYWAFVAYQWVGTTVA